MTSDLQKTIEQAWEDRAQVTPGPECADIRQAVQTTIAGLDSGHLRVAEKIDSEWVVHQWIKKAVLLSFRLENNAVKGQAPLQRSEERRVRQECVSTCRSGGSPNH